MNRYFVLENTKTILLSQYLRLTPNPTTYRCGQYATAEHLSMQFIKSTFLFALILMGGCAKDSGVLKANESESLFSSTICYRETNNLSEEKFSGETYRIFQQAFSGFVPLSAVREDIENQASNFCKNNNKQVKKIAITNSPMGLGCPAKAELIFACIEPKNADTTEDALYLRLSNLKKLLDSGALTKEEFDQQKEKLLKP